MKIAYLIMVHDRPDRLKRLVNAVQTPWADIYVHVDKRVALSPFKEGLRDFPVRFIEPRVKVHWMGWSDFLAMLRLLREASHHRKYDYYKFLTGTCYPVKPNEYIYSFLKRHLSTYYAAKEWGAIDYRAKRTEAENFAFKIRYYHFIDRIPIAPFLRKNAFRQHPIKTLARHPFSILYWSIFYLCFYKPGILSNLVPPRKPPMEVWMGNAFYCLRHEFVTYLLQELDANPRIAQFFSHTHAPSELLIPSMLRQCKEPKHEFSRLFTSMHRNQSSLTEELILNRHRFPSALFVRKCTDAHIDFIDSLLAGNLKDGEKRITAP